MSELLRRFLYGLIWLSALAAVLAFAFGFAGRLHPAGDSFAVFRLYFAGAAAVFLFVLGLVGSRVAWGACATILLFATPTALSYLRFGEARGGNAAIYQKNLYFRGYSPELIAEDILNSGADIVTLQELSQSNKVVLDLLRSTYPTQAYCSFNAIGGTAVLSRWPAKDGEVVCSEQRGLTAVELDVPGHGPIWAVSLHLHWPWPYGQAKHVRALLPQLAGLEGHVVIGGDFNMVPWGSSVMQIETATRTEHVGPTSVTLRRAGRFALLPIDHVLLPQGWRAALEIRPELGSDHRGVLVSFTLP